MPSLIEDTSGGIEYGLFFALDAFQHEYWQDYSRAIVCGSVSRTPVNVEASERDEIKEASGWCPHHPRAEDIRRLKRLEVWLHGGETDGQVMSGMDGSDLLVSRKVATTLAAAGFRGTRFIEVKVAYNSSNVDETTLLAVCFDGRIAYRPEIVVPPEANHCRVCGRAPYVCPVCGHRDEPCPVCGENTLSYLGQADTSSHIKLVPSARDGRVISLDRWDGNDFPGGRIVTGRVVDVLISLNPRVLCAQPLRCHVSDNSTKDTEEIRSQVYSRRYGH